MQHLRPSLARGQDLASFNADPLFPHLKARGEDSCPAYLTLRPESIEKSMKLNHHKETPRFTVLPNTSSKTLAGGDGRNTHIPWRGSEVSTQQPSDQNLERALVLPCGVLVAKTHLETEV